MGTVLWRTEAGATPRGLDELWQKVAARGWLGRPAERVVIHVGAEHRDSCVVETVQSLIRFLAATAPARRVEVLDLAPDPGPWGPRWIDRAALRFVAVQAVRLRGAARIPTLWLEQFRLVTITGAAPSPRLGLAAVLAAQATLLDRPVGGDLDVVFEAHRLLAPDVSVACGSVRFGAPQTGSWWAISDSDLALERAVARAMGGAPAVLPALRHVARHELVDDAIVDAGEPVTLAGYRSPALLVAAARLARTVRDRIGVVVADLRATGANLHRIPAFVRKRLPLGGGARA